MRVFGIQKNVAFGRALNSKELGEYKGMVAEAKQKLGLESTSATIFDFSFPSSDKNTGIGSSFSKDAQNMAEFFKTMCGINTIQLQPQGEISNYVRSPYSGTSFSLGMHIIDLTKLSEDSYGRLLTEEDLNSPYMTRVKQDENVDYDNVFAQDGQERMLKKAYKNFNELDKAHFLKKEYEKFKKDNSYWLEKDALFEACAVANGSRDIRTWSNRDQNVFAKKEGDKSRISELKKVTDKEGNNVEDFSKFVQYIADRQQKESKENFNKQGIEIFGDCQIGFSQKDYWAHKSAFYDKYEFGCDIGDGKYSCWSPAIDFNKLNGDAGELLYNKFNIFFKRYNGVRIDAAWQFIKPLICEPIQSNGEDVFDSQGNKLGEKISVQPKVGNHGQHIIKDIILKAAHKNGVPAGNVLLELLGGNAYESLDAVKGDGTSLIHITRYGKPDWGRVKYYESKGENKYQGMKPGDYTIGPGTHDDISMIEQVKEGKAKAEYLSSDLHCSKTELQNNPASLSKAMFAELFTTKKQFATIPDIIGSERRINTPNTVEGNWIYRVPRDYERAYFENLSKGKGLNFPDALSKAIKARQITGNVQLTKSLDKYAKILTEKGPMTTKEADKLMLNA